MNDFELYVEMCPNDEYSNNTNNYDLNHVNLIKKRLVNNLGKYLVIPAYLAGYRYIKSDISLANDHTKIVNILDNLDECEIFCKYDNDITEDYSINVKELYDVNDILQCNWYVPVLKDGINKPRSIITFTDPFTHRFYCTRRKVLCIKNIHTGISYNIYELVNTIYK